VAALEIQQLLGRKEGRRAGREGGRKKGKKGRI
jgi:hypothetical protein